MNINDLDHQKKWFSEYVAGYYTGDRDYDFPIRLKEEHTEKVCDNIRSICGDLQLPEQDRLLAETIALFHDLGRFEQYIRYGTFNDAVSINHARLSLMEIGKNRLLSRFATGDKRLISKAVAHHNAPSLGGNHPERDILFMRLIRDADKLDVWRVLIDYYRNRGKQQNRAIELGLPDEPTCSQEIIDAFFNHRTALLKDARTNIDIILLQISWVFDLNFTQSFQMAQQQQLMSALIGFLPPLPVVQKAVEFARSYVRHRLQPGRV